MTALSTIWRAPAKLNLTLEVIGHRADGYHEVRSVVTLLNLEDRLRLEEGRGFTVFAGEDYDASAMPDGLASHNTVELALAYMTALRFQLPLQSDDDVERALRRGLSEVSISLTKCVPAAAGLGGGSSDGATALRALNAHWRMGLDWSVLADLALRIGSDCPLFLQGGTQFVGGRGERIQSLRSPAKFWCCVVDPGVRRASKTALMYSLLRPEHFGNGERSAALMEKLQRGCAMIEPDDLFNTFEMVAESAFGSLEPVRKALRDAGALGGQLCGAGPALFGLAASERHAHAIQQALAEDGWTACVAASVSG